MRSMEELLQESVAFHGHLCAGQVLGVRMSMIGCRSVGVDEPRDTKDLLVYVEIDRCAADAIQSVTGCKLGKRTLKHVDYGKMAATFLNETTGQAVRVLARDDSREAAPAYAPPETTRQDAQLQAYMVMPEDKLFVVTPVLLQVPRADMPGPPVSRVTCEECGEGVNDRREVEKEGRTLCRACALGAYYQVVTPEPTQNTERVATSGE